MVCCRLGEPETKSVWSEDSCDGKCVPAAECEAASDSVDLMVSGSGCTGNNVCCKKLPNSCDGVCISSTQCSDPGINLRFNIANCPANQVCCQKPSTVNNDVCKGKCVSPSQCSDYNPVRGLIDLRFSDGNCPANQICCNNVKISRKCNGLCLPRARCDDAGIGTDFDNEQCPNNEVCCQKPKTSGSKKDSATCKGTCLPTASCPNAEQGINLRISEGCTANEVCCATIQFEGCDGTCTTVDRCADIPDNAKIIDLRLGSSECPSNKICCKKLRSEETKCDGICVPQHQCPELNNWRSVINLRSSETSCPFKQVCCKNPVFTDCVGKCVPQEQCKDEVKTFDLRSFAVKCQPNNVCCKNLKQVECDGECVVPQDCPDHGSTNAINIRLVDQVCPFGKICCMTTKKSNVCNGSCIPHEQCGDESNGLRLSDSLCSGTSVCCKKPKPLISISRTSDSCDGTCLPRNLCSDKKPIDVRAFDNACPESQICCKVPKKQPVCDGTCAPLDQCMDSTQNINLRFSNDSCPYNQICCRNLKLPSSNCNGKCVPTSQCPRNSLRSDPVDLRFGRASCPVGEVCCQDLEICDGSCVPKDQCDDNSNSNGINLRFGKPLCPVNQVCCKKHKVVVESVAAISTIPGSCNGTCLTRNLCSDKESINLRSLNDVCPGNQICCKVTKKQSVCDGTCAPLDQCLDTTQNINLRFSHNNCPSNQVCCKNLKQRSSTCNGKCIPANQCPTKSFSSNPIDLRFVSFACPVGEVCCQDLEVCDGSCVPENQCDDTFFSNEVNLRFGKPLCPVNKVCCKKRKVLIEPVTPVSRIPGPCDGTCLPRNLCSDKESINLRAFGVVCPESQICCKVLKKQFVCNGTCATLDQCLDSTQNINLRSTNDYCPNNQICCKNLKTPNSTCNGKCVPASECPLQSLGSYPVDLRFGRGACSAGEVCCQDLEICDGSCVPKNQCNDTSTSNGVNLRFGKALCPVNQVCCKNPKSSAVELCNGKCVPKNECPGNIIDLRATNGKCPPNQVCCMTDSCSGTCVPYDRCADLDINLRYMERKCSTNHVCCQKLKESPTPTCPGQCVLPNQCPNDPPGKLIDLRLANNNGCPNGQICCEPQTPIRPPSLLMDILDAPILEISPTSRPTMLSSASSCAFSSDPSAEYVAKADVPWLVSIWSRQEIFGIQRRQYECVGTLIKSDLVLTSADCLKGFSGDQLYARVGDFNLKPLETLSPRREFNITESITHPDYDSQTGLANLAVLRLSKNATKSSSVCLPERTELDPTAPCFLVGWNKQDLTNESRPNATPDKHSVELKDGANCDEGYICSDDNHSKSQCAKAFQGSPIICFIGSSRSWIQRGLAVGSSKKCNTLEVPHSFVSIASYEMWIKEQITPSFQQIPSVVDPLRTYLPPGA